MSTFTAVERPPAGGPLSGFAKTNPIFVIHDLLSPPVALRGDGRNSIVVATVGRPFLPATETETAPSILWLAPIQCVEGKQDLADLAPKGCFIPAKPIEREVGQIGEAQKAAGEVSGAGRFRLGAGHGFRSSCDAMRGSIGLGIDRVCRCEHRVDDFS